MGKIMNSLININGNLIDIRFVYEISNIYICNYQYQFELITPEKTYIINRYIGKDYDLDKKVKDNIISRDNELCDFIDYKTLLDKYKLFFDYGNNNISEKFLKLFSKTVNNLNKTRDDIIKFRNKVLAQDDMIYIISN